MEREYSVVCEEGLAQRIDALASEYDTSQEEVIRQLLAVGLDELDR